MQKKKIMLGLAVFAALNVGNYAFASDNPFATVPQKTGYYQDVASLVHAGLIDGYTDSDFNAKHPLTRYEMAVFTAKAMSNMQSADAADTQRIQKLMKEFQSELTDLHVRVPGVKAKKSSSSKSSAKGPKVKNLPMNWDVSGLMRFRLDGGRKDYANGTSKHGADGFGGQKNKQLMWQLFNKFDIGGGWKGELDFIGAKDGNGDKRTTGENTDGYADVNNLFATGPIGKTKWRIGRTKGSFVGAKSMVMGQYYEGGDVSYRTGKWNLGAAWGKVDYVNNAFTGDPSAINTVTKDGKYIYKAERGVSGSDMNPDGLGVYMTQLQFKNQVNKDLAVDFGYWHLQAHGQNLIKDGAEKDCKYPNPDLGEVNVDWQATPKLDITGHFAMSNMRGRADNYFDKSKGKDGDKNKAYAVTFRWGKVQPVKAHSRQFQLDLIHMEQFTGIKSTYDLKNKMGEGQQGFIADYRYVPVKNVMFDFRWMHYKTLGMNSYKASDFGKSFYHGNQYRFQLYYYF